MIYSMVMALVVGIMSSACVTSGGFQAAAPVSFAPLTDSGESLIKAVNPDGVVYRVRTVPQETKADLAFWRESLTRKLEAEGYTVVATSDATLAGNPGAAVEAVAPLQGEDYGFLVAFSLVGDEVLIVEGAGPHAAWKAAKPGMLAAADAINHKK
jgi:hypothetical protein